MILVTGAARSGTSLTTAILAKCGANLGKVNGLNECLAVRDGLIKPYLDSIGMDRLGQRPLPEIADLKPDPDWRAKVLGALGGADAYKDAKICLMWPVWAEAFPEARWVIVRRSRERIIDSCLRTGFMRAYDTREGWGRWVDHHLARFEELKANVDCAEVWPGADPEAFRPVAEHCGLGFDPAVVAQVFKHDQWHG